MVMSKGMTRAGLYARVSTTDQTPANQLDALQAFAAARSWAAAELVYHGVSGAKERRPALDALMAAVRARKVDVVACVKLDRLARSTHHLVSLAKELEALSVDLVVLDQAN
jgi:DNA invertase Pin-like site-specific DNA recombinase